MARLDFKQDIGVTGFMTPQEARRAIEFFRRQMGVIDIMDNVEYLIDRIMIGVLARSKTLNGETNKYPRQFPPVDQIKEIFQDDPLALNLIHYSTDTPENLFYELGRLHDLGGEHCHGFQLNVIWPEIEPLTDYKERYPKTFFVLQIGSTAIQIGENEPRRVADMVKDYKGVIDAILIDLSGGLGKLFNPEIVRGYLQAIRDLDLGIKLGVAGGIGPEQDSHRGLLALQDEFSNLSFDAQGNLRDSGSGDLDLEKVKKYIQGTCPIFTS